MTDLSPVIRLVSLAVGGRPTAAGHSGARRPSRCQV